MPSVALIEPLFKALNEAGVRYVVVGGLAVVLHGYARLTADVDLIVDLDEEEARKAIEALVAIGLRPRAPVDPDDFSRRSVREAWVRDRGMQVFSMVDPSNPMLVVDLFATHPIPFEELWSGAREMTLDDATVRVASIPHLIRLKRMSGRAQDQIDIEHLEAIQRERGGEDA
jgi:predicted nucleotidyltransferase